MQEMTEEIIAFLNAKGIKDDFIRNIVSGFIINHTELYGDIVSFDDLMSRLNENLKSIDLIDPNTKQSEEYLNNVVGRYEGFDKNSIIMFFSKKDLINEQLREDFIGILLHELTHCAYTIKQDDKNNEMHVFGIYQQLSDGTTPLISGSLTFKEPIINFISTRICGAKNGAYLAQTSYIAKLANIVGEKDIIRSAFDSNEDLFRECFKVFPEGSYEYFTDGMEWLNSSGQYSFRKGTEIMQNFFAGNIPELTYNQKRIKEFKEIKKTISQLRNLSETVTLEPEFNRTLKKQGFVNMYLLIIGLIMVIAVVIAITLELLKV